MADSEIEQTDAEEPASSGLDGSEPERSLLVSAHHSYQGPLPPAQELAKYEETLPGLAQTIVDMAQKEQAFRHQTSQYEQETERKCYRQLATKTYLGQIGAFVITTTALGGSFWLINNGHSAAGIAGIVAALATLAAVFIAGKRSAPNEEPASDDSNQK